MTNKAWAKKLVKHLETVYASYREAPEGSYRAGMLMGFLHAIRHVKVFLNIKE